MNARKLIMGGLGVVLAIAGVLLLTRDGEEAVPGDGRVPAGEVSGLNGVAPETPDVGNVEEVGEGETSTPATSPDGSDPALSGPADAGGSGNPGTADVEDRREPVARPLTVPPPAERPAEQASEPPAEEAAEQPAPRQEVEEILRATSRRYEGVRALQADFRQRLTNTLMGRTTESAGTLYQRQPDRFLMRFSQPEGDMVVSDGDYFWLYYPSVDPRQVIRSARGAGGLDLRAQFVGDPVERFEATSHGGETVRGRATHVLTLDPREPLGYRRLKVWIDAEDHLVRRFELTEDNGNVRLFDLTDLRVNPTLADELFEFEPPAGAVIVTR